MSGHCPVCRQSVASSPITCPKCETVHHRDCWDYNGRCGVFGCAKAPGAASAGKSLPPLAFLWQPFAFAWIVLFALEVEVPCDGYFFLMTIPKVLALFSLPAWLAAASSSRSGRYGLLAAVVLVSSDFAGIFVRSRQERFSRQIGTVIVHALEAYQRDHGDYPDKLKALVPKYLAEVPQTCLGFFGRPFDYYREIDTFRLGFGVGGGASGHYTKYDRSYKRWHSHPYW